MKMKKVNEPLYSFSAYLIPFLPFLSWLLPCPSEFFHPNFAISALQAQNTCFYAFDTS